MKLEVILSVVNLYKKDLEKMNITSRCIVINQCDKKKEENYKNFKIYSYNEKGVSVSRNRGIDNSKEDILLFCDNDVVYNKDYEKLVLEEFNNNKDADAIVFNVINLGRKKRIIKKRKKLHIYNSLNYATYNIAVRRKSILEKNIRFNILFGPGAIYKNGSDTMFIVDILKNKLNMYSSPYVLGEIKEKPSTWFNGYDEEYFYNKGILFTAISSRFRHLLMLQHIIRHKYMLVNYSFIDAYKIMLKGSRKYLNDINNSNKIKNR